jgi:tetratricopeptide (TPR) repeat protein
VWDKALTYAREAGARAVGRSASREAVASFERALKALTHLPQTRDVIEQAIDLRFAMRHALFPLGEQAEISQRLQEAEALADSVGDQRRLGRVACYMTSCYWAMGEYDRAIASGERALALAVALGDVTLRIDTSLQLGYTYHAVGSYREAMELLRSGESFLHETKLPPRLIAFFKVFGRCCLGWCFADLGEFEAGRASVEEGIHLAEAADHLYGLVAGCSSLGMLHLTRGVYADAIPVLERALRLCQISNFPVFLPMSAACLGAAYAQSGRLDEGLALLEQIVRRDTTSKHMVGQARWLVYYAEALIQGDRLAEAREAAVRAVSLARACRERGHEAAALWVSGEVAARREDTDGADALYREAMALARRLNMRPLMAHCLAGLGANHRRMGRVEDGFAELSAAIELYRSLGMSPALSKAEGRLALG